MAAQALLLITTEGSPQVKAPARWSSAFKHFLQCSLHVQVERRATAEQLLLVRCACVWTCVACVGVRLVWGNELAELASSGA